MEEGFRLVCGRCVCAGEEEERRTACELRVLYVVWLAVWCVCGVAGSADTRCHGNSSCAGAIDISHHVACLSRDMRAASALDGLRL